MPHFEPESLQIASGISARVVTGDTMTVLHVVIESGALLPEHSHHHEQILNLIEGELLLVVDGTEFTMRAGDVMFLPSNEVVYQNLQNYLLKTIYNGSLNFQSRFTGGC